jgi:hypothetical protein
VKEKIDKEGLKVAIGIDLNGLYENGDSDYNFWLLLPWTRYSVYRARELELSRNNLSPEQALILSIVYDKDGNLSPSKIYSLTSLKPHSLKKLASSAGKELGLDQDSLPSPD